MERIENTEKQKVKRIPKASRIAKVARKAKSISKIVVKEPETAYLTTRALERALSKATRNLTEKAMDIQGYVVTIHNKWVVKKYKDGRVERMKRIRSVKLSKRSGRS